MDLDQYGWFPPHLPSELSGSSSDEGQGEAEEDTEVAEATVHVPEAAPRRQARS